MRETKLKKRYRPCVHECTCELCGKTFKGQYVYNKYCTPCSQFVAFSNKYGPTKAGLRQLINEYLAGRSATKELIWELLPEDITFDTQIPYMCTWCKRNLKPAPIRSFLGTFKFHNFFFTKCKGCTRAINMGRTELYNKQYIENYIKENNLENLLRITNLEEKVYGVHEKIGIECLIHNTYTQQTIKNFLSGQVSCKECQAEKIDSRGMQAIKTFLETNNIEYTAEETFEGLYGVGNGKLKADIYIPSMKVWAEFDGQYHFLLCNRSNKEGLLRQILNDQIKNTYCKNEGIRLIRIPYWQEKRIPEFLEFLVTGEESILPTVHPQDSIYQDMPKKNAELRRKLLQQPAE